MRDNATASDIEKSTFAVATVTTAAREFADTASQTFGSEAEIYHATVAGIHRLCAAMLKAEAAGASPEQLREAVEPARALHSQSPFVNRLQTWPRGYAGDFETIEYICDGQPKLPTGSVAHAIEIHTLRDISSQQHRNKVAWQAKLMLEAVLARSDARVLSIACGGARDLDSIQHLVAGRGARFFLNDMDADALALAQRRLGSLSAEVECLPGDVFSAVRGFRKLAPLDLVVAGGLFDYLTDRQIGWLLEKLWPLMREGGRICFTNLAVGNPDRIWLQYIANWQIIERSEAHMRELAGSLTPAPSAILTKRETTGLTLLTEVRRG